MSARTGDEGVPTDLRAWTDAGSRLVNKGIASGDPRLVRQAVERFESVLAATHAEDHNYAAATANTANALVVEFELTARADALDRAIVLLDAIEPDSAALGAGEANFFSILGHALLRDAERTGLPVTAERAVAARRRALALTPKLDPARPARLCDLGSVLAMLFRITGDLAVLREAVRVQEAGTRGMAPEADSFPGALSLPLMLVPSSSGRPTRSAAG